MGVARTMLSMKEDSVECSCYSAAMPRSQAPAARVEWMSDIIRLEIALWERIDVRLRAEHDVPLSFFESLYCISRAPRGTLRVGDLADALRITIGGVSKLVDRMERAGLLERRPDPRDRRAALIALTPAGRRKLQAALTTYGAEVSSLVDPVLTPSEQDQMRAYVTRLLTAADTGEPS